MGAPAIFLFSGTATGQFFSVWRPTSPEERALDAAGDWLVVFLSSLNKDTLKISMAKLGAASVWAFLRSRKQPQPSINLACNRALSILILLRPGGNTNLALNFDK